MEVSIHELDGVIIRHFSGKVCFQDIVKDWEKLIITYNKLDNYKGILHNYLDAEFEDGEHNLNELVDFLKENLDKLKNLRIAVVMDTPLVTNTIIMGQKAKPLQIKPFSTVEAGMQWIQH